jgi:hypothetical protein
LRIDPIELMERLAAQIPKPRINLVGDVDHRAQVIGGGGAMRLQAAAPPPCYNSDHQSVLDRQPCVVLPATGRATGHATQQPGRTPRAFWAARLASMFCKAPAAQVCQGAGPAPVTCS